MKKIALTASIGSGKSYVLQKIKDMGIPCIDVDKMAKDIREQNEEKITAMFHVSDKDALRTLVFQDVKMRKRLEAFLYPKILKKLLQEMEKYNIVVVEVPLLFESGWDIYFDEVWVVSCHEEVAIKRLQQYRNMDNETIVKIMATQMPNEEKEKQADFIIYNNDEDDVSLQIKERMKQICYK